MIKNKQQNATKAHKSKKRKKHSDNLTPEPRTALGKWARARWGAVAYRYRLSVLRGGLCRPRKYDQLIEMVPAELRGDCRKKEPQKNPTQ